MRYSKVAVLNLVPNKVEVNCDVFHPRVKYRVGAEMSCTDIVTIDHWALRQGDV